MLQFSSRIQRKTFQSGSYQFFKLFHNHTPLMRHVADSYSTSKEETITNILRENLKPQKLKVSDISGGCGAMFEIYVMSKEFEGKSMLKQHKLVYDLLRDEISQMHGLTLHTKAPPPSPSPEEKKQ